MRISITRIVALALIAVLVGGLAYLRLAPDADPVSVPAGAKPGDLALKPCDYATENGSYGADCGTLVVPENRANPRSRKELLPYLPNGHQVVLADIGHTTGFWGYQPEAGSRLINTFFASGKVDDSLYQRAGVDFTPEVTQTRLAKGFAATMVGLALLTVLALLWMAWRVHKRGGFGRKVSASLRSLFPVVLGLGIFWAWVRRDWAANTRIAGFAAAMGGRTRGWLAGLQRHHRTPGARHDHHRRDGRRKPDPHRPRHHRDRSIVRADYRSPRRWQPHRRGGAGLPQRRTHAVVTRLTRARYPRTRRLLGEDSCASASSQS